MTLGPPCYVLLPTNTCALVPISHSKKPALITRRDGSTSAREQTKPDYLKINRKAACQRSQPSAAADGTPAISPLIAQTHPEAELAPLDDPFAFAELQSFMSYLCATLHVAHAHRMRGYRWADHPAAHEAMKKKVPAVRRRLFDLIERKIFLGRGLWARTTRSPTPPLHHRTLDGGRQRGPDSLSARARPSRRMAQRPAVQRALKAEGLA